MPSLNINGILFFLLFAFIYGVHSLDYADLEALDVACPERDSCKGYMNNLTYMDRSCECDYACIKYKDCCIDAWRRPSRRDSLPNRMACMPYGEHSYQGVYVIVNCNSNWKGSEEIRQRCEGPQNLTDPLTAAPVTSVVQRVTYRNRFCAECNYANLPTLKTFQIKIACNELIELPEEQLLVDFTYNKNFDSWGIYRKNSFGNATTKFVVCDVIFDVPDYLNNSVRFCRSSVISSCPPDWKRPQVEKNCEEYTAVVYGNVYAYKNVHCAICNNMTVSQVTCTADLVTSSRRRPTSFILLALDINPNDTDKVGMKKITYDCPTKQIYDPIIKECRQLVCALPNHVLQNGKCVRG